MDPSAVGHTGLYLAAENGHEVVVQLPLKHMVDVDAKDNDGWTARYIRQLRTGTRQCAAAAGAQGGC
jgi:hypothetical protein